MAAEASASSARLRHSHCGKLVHLGYVCNSVYAAGKRLQQAAV